MQRRLPHRGQVVGIIHGCAVRRAAASEHRADDAGNHVAGLLDDRPQSPSRMSLRAMSSALCSVAIEIGRAGDEDRLEARQTASPRPCGRR